MRSQHLQMFEALFGEDGDLAWLDRLLGRFGDGFAALEIIRDTAGQVVDERYLGVSGDPGTIGAPGAIGHTVTELIPDIDPRWFRVHAEIAASGRV